MSQDVFRNAEGALFFGPVSSAGLYTSQATITNAMIHPDATISPDKVTQQYVITRLLSTTETTDAAAVTLDMHTAVGAGEIVSVDFYPSVAATGTTSNSVQDFNVNGSSTLTGTLSLTPSDTARTPKAATLSAAAYSAGDRLTAKITSASAGDGAKPQGIYCRLVLREAAS